MKNPSTKTNEELIKENFRRFLDDSPLGARIVSAAGETIYANRALLDIYGYEGIEELQNTSTKERYTPESYAEFLVRLEKRQRGEFVPSDYEISILRKDGNVRRLQVFRKEILWNGKPQFQTLLNDITDRKRAEEERKAHIRFLESLERVDQAIREETDVEQMLRNILQTAFSIFDCDRAWLLYPCDPDAPSFRVPVEITRPEYPGAKVLNADVPMSPGEARNMREALESDDPVTYTAGTERPVSTAKQFGVQSQMFMPVYPKLGKPWVFGMHQCSYPRIWTTEEKKIFKEIGRRISDGLSSVLFLRELQESAERYKNLFENHAAVKLLIDPDTGSIIEANEAAVNYYGWSHEQLRQMKIQEINTLPPENVKKEISKARTQKRIHFEFRHRRADGSIRDVEVFSSKIEVKGKDILHSIIHDITERKRAEEELGRVDRALRLLSDTNQALIRITDETTLLNEICRISVEIGGYRLTWVGFAEQDEAKTVRPAAYAGNDSGYIESAKITWADTERGRGPGGTAVRTGQPCMVRNIPLDPAFAPWREEAIRRGYQSIIALPLINEGRTFAVMGIYAGEADAFDAKEVEILKELANDLAFGITALRTRAKRDRAEEQLHMTLDRLRKAVGATIQVLASAVEARDPYTAGHQTRSAELARAIATEMGLPQDRIDAIRMAGSIHDIGKLSVPAEILSTPQKLKEVALLLIQEHSRIGYELLKDVESPWPLAEIVYQHHERMNGTGYPRNLKGDDILLEARIMAVADVVEAMASHRPYRPALGIDAALAEIEMNKGTLYDNTVADACLRLFREKDFKLEGS